MSHPAAKITSMTKGERTKNRILMVATQQFSLAGYEATNLRSIAGLAKIQVPGLYKYFANKEALYEAVLTYNFTPIQEALDETLNASSANSIQALPEVIINIFKENPHVVRLFHQAMINNDDVGSQITQDWLSLFFGKSRILLKQFDSTQNTQQLSIKLLAVYNMIIGYFISEKIFLKFDHGSIFNDDNIRQQINIASSVMKILFSAET